ncbi:MAG: 3-hydroxybutyryl-CoA dehydrogenase, partial [Phenylobacterium sp.]|nr:3-hydroxybutyryl-CoA dehydrogenase [Phenylobacterium sp.]
MVDIKSVGVIGAGQMGSGIAHVCALGGYDVLLHDVSSDRIDAGLQAIERNMMRQVVRGIIDQSAMDEGLKRIKAAPELQTIGATDLAIEAATENEETKKAIFKALGPHLGDKTLLASNTSSISITRLASVTARPDRF